MLITLRAKRVNKMELGNFVVVVFFLLRSHSLISPFFFIDRQFVMFPS